MPNEPPAKLIETRPALEGDPDIVHPSMGIKLGKPPQKYTRAVHERICEELRKGQRPQGACARAGITLATFYDWVQRGKNGDPHLYEFAQDVEIAFNSAEAAAVDVVSDAMTDPGDPDLRFKAATWRLERSRPDGYSKQVKTAVESQILKFMQTLEKALDESTFQKVLAVYMGFAPAAEMTATKEATALPPHVEDDES